MIEKQKLKPEPPHPGDQLVMDEIRRELILPAYKKPHGSFMCGSPLEMEIDFDFTGPRGSGPNVYYSYVFQLPKWGFNVKKVDEWVEVTPEFAEYYQITMEQKRKLMESIKSGLAEATKAVADYELMAHDVRRYREILDYFKKGSKDEHVIRSLFVDRVDAFTGEGYSMVTMAKRWPTIISDFIRMKEEWTDVNKIRQELDVSQAEATVLKTKNELFKEWKTMFLPAIKERYARIHNITEARKKSINVYKEWLKPYISQVKMIRERTEKKPSINVNNPYFTPGFGQTQAQTGVRIWGWRPFTPADLRRKSMEKEEPWKNSKGKALKFVVNPYDEHAKEWKERIEEKYGVEISDDDVWDIAKGAVSNDEMDPNQIYYEFFEGVFQLNLIKTPPPESMDVDNLMITPLKAWYISQNVILGHLIELKARELAFEDEVNKMIGAPEFEEKKLEEIEKEFEKVEEEVAGKTEKESKLKGFVDAVNSAGSKVKKPLESFFYLFVRRGPYEPIFKERVSKMFSRAMGPSYKKQLDLLKSEMGVG